MTTKTQKTIQNLRALIDHPRTGDNEREAARRMLKRILDKAHKQGEQIAGGYHDHRVYGDKYDKVRNLSVVEIAKFMREDIKLAMKVAKATTEPGTVATFDAFAAIPDGVKITVRTRHYTSIDIVVRNIPEAWGWTEEETPWGHKRAAATPALKALGEALKTIHHAYNYDGSDVSTDYFDVNYYGGVCNEHGRHIA
jgi:hypothetical protein